MIKRKKSSAKAWAESQETGGPRYLRLPEGTRQFKLKKSKYKINIIPYIAGPGNPSADEGYEHFERTFYVHRDLGPDGRDAAICNQKTFNTRCVVCEEMGRLRAAGHQWEELKKYSPKQRHVWRVVDMEDQETGIQIFETGHTKTFGGMLKNKIQAVEEYENFSDLDGGRMLVLSVQEESMGSTKFMAVANIEMVERKKPLPAAWLEKEPNLDELIQPADQKRLKKLLDLNSEADEDEVDHEAETPPPARRRAAPPPDIDEDEEETPPAKPAKKAAAVVDDNDEEPAPKPKPAAKRAPVVEEDDEEEEVPPAKPAKKVPVAVKPPADDDEDDYEDDDDLPRKPAAKAKR